MNNDQPLPPSKRWMLPVAIVVVIAVAGGVMSMRPAKPVVPEKVDTPAVMELAAADVFAVVARDLRVQLPMSGSLTAQQQAIVKSKVAGEVREAPVAEGIRVRRGEVVVRLDTGDLKARVGAQEGALDDARARLALASKNRENSNALLKQKFISQNALDTSQNGVDLAMAAVKSASAQLDIARRALDDAQVRSPIDGIISKRYVQAGEKAAPDMALFAVVDLSRLILEAPVPASEIPRVQVGQGVSFAVDGFGTRLFAGDVVRINPAAEPGSRAIIVYVAVANADGALKSGMYAKGGITLGKSSLVPAVPVAALRSKDGVTTVLRIDGNKINGNKIVEQIVQPGLRNEEEGMVEITDGLAVGMQVLAVRLDGVKAGTLVKLPTPKG
ncbi:efflux RND transporter periplasmic adaptor subunit [Actimicrobium sp. CCI2.3]|uniref:efflux RND transporter periplasmic adaptor subunit n=1 Tax=Actimicrobium sp. CCI2.3 TaxID=3048616 RepID=UPI002AB450DF|nr:efflux RND transporter periplasmic adaptor subunit [Actimicrobium sp. CCI2.3]MDY7576200.1 efflux RND transporter periplasmic adaptor subunit [Actimicrobium sp. CCI2.3]MEB0020595.1 efflux RND transporter periplasmic adaptor subunit [Actimicrobium sp. CCI2.3]